MRCSNPAFFCVLLSFFTCTQTLWTQNVWQTVIPNDRNQFAADIAPAADGNYWILTNMLGTDVEKEIRLLKMNPSGILLDSIVFPRSVGHQLCPLADGGMVITGQRTIIPNWSGMKALVIKLDAQGVVEWQQEIDQGYLGYASAATPDGTGGYYIGGLFDQVGAIDRAFLSHLSSTGTVLWNTTHLILGSACVQKIVVEGNTLIAFGGMSTIGVGPDGFFLLRANASNGAQLSRSTQNIGRFLTVGFYYNVFPPMGLARTPEGKIWVSRPGRQDEGPGSGAYLYETGGQLLKQMKVSTLSDYYRFPTDLSLDADGAIIMAGAAGNAATQLHPYIEKRATNGTLIWTHAFPSSGQLYAFTPTPDGGFIACGTNYRSMQLASGASCRALIMRFDSSGNVHPCHVTGRVLHDLDANCQADAQDSGVPLASLVLDDTISLSADRNGYFEAWIPPGLHRIRVLDGQPLYAACQGSVEFTVDLADPVKNIDFLLVKGPDCPKLEVGVTQTSLTPCDTATLFLSWKNKGNAEAQGAFIRLKADATFTLIDAAAPYTVLPDGVVEFPLGSVGVGTQSTIRLRLKLACDAVTYGSYGVEAVIEPRTYCWTDAPNWQSAVLQVKGTCTGDKIRFQVQNTGNLPLASPAPYRMYIDGALMETGFVSPAPGQSDVFDFPADGRCLVFETDQAPDYPVISYPGDAVEGCGLAANGFFSTGFRQMFDQYDAEPWVSRVSMVNSAPLLDDRLSGMYRGYGYYHWTEPRESWHEFSGNVINHSGHAADSVILVLYPSKEFDPASFELLAWSHRLIVERAENGFVRLHATGMSLQDGEAVQFRFRMHYRPDDTSGSDFTAIGGEAFFDNEPQQILYDAFYNITEGFVAGVISPDSDDPDVSLFGRGDALDFIESQVQTPNGDVYLLGGTFSFGEKQPITLTRLDSTGKGIWQKSYVFNTTHQYPTSILPLADNGVLICGSLEDETQENYVNYHYAFIARIDSAGEVKWLRKWRPGITGGTLNDAVLAPDGSAVFIGKGYGYSSGSFTGLFMYKITPDNELVFNKNLLVGYALGGYIKRGKNGDFYFWAILDNALAGNVYSLLRYDWNGNFVQENPFQNPTGFYGYYSDFAPTQDDGLVMAGTTYFLDTITQTYYTVMDVTRLDHQAHEVWHKTYSIPFLQEIVSVETIRGAVFIGGTSGETTTQDAMLVKLDTSGALIWVKTYPVNAREYGNQVLTGQHNRLWFTAQTQSTDNLYNLQMVLMRTSDPDVVSATSDPVGKEISLLSVWPTPAHDVLWITGLQDLQHGQLMVFDAAGSLVLTTAWSEGQAVSVGLLPCGMYQFRLQGDGGVVGMGRFVKI